MTLKPDLVCQQCGRPEAHVAGDEILCSACYHERGSCGAVPEPPDAGDGPALKPETDLPE
jgi:NMD protein affecting ribosome stability and mRNA decay